MTVREHYTLLCERFPSSLGEICDNDGLMCCPDSERAVNKILFALDVTDAVVSHAVDTGADLIVSHHPLIFAKISSLTSDTPVGRRLIRLAQAGISVFSFHTRFDRVSGGVNDTLASILGLSCVEELGDDEASLGRIGTLPKKMSLFDFSEWVKRALGVGAVQVWDANCPVHRVAVVGGEGQDFIEAATAAGADTYLSGRLGYHAMQDARINLVEAGHYFTERPAVAALESVVRELFPEAKTEIYTPNPLTVY